MAEVLVAKFFNEIFENSLFSEYETALFKSLMNRFGHKFNTTLPAADQFGRRGADETSMFTELIDE